MLKSALIKTNIYSVRGLSARFLTYNRTFSSGQQIKDDMPKAKPITQKVAKIKKYWFHRYIDYIANFDETLEKTFPRMMHIYRLISVGTKDLYVDLKKYVTIKKKETLHGSENLSREELHLSHSMPRDLAKITPVLLVLAIPFTNYILFPMAYFFPKKILTSHYWTPEQKDKFIAIDHKTRRKYMERIFTSLQQEKHIAKSDTREHWNELTKTLRNKRDPSPEVVLACKPLFSDGPFSLQTLKRPHVRELLLLYDICTCAFYKREALMERGVLIKRMDIAIMKEGGASKMSPNALKTTLSFRGIDPTDMSTEGMEKWMDKWLQVSNEVDNKSMSLLLHCPVLLAYNWNTT